MKLQRGKKTRRRKYHERVARKTQKILYLASPTAPTAEIIEQGAAKLLKTSRTLAWVDEPEGDAK